MKEKMTGFKTQVDWGGLRIKTGRRAEESTDSTPLDDPSNTNSVDGDNIEE